MIEIILGIGVMAFIVYAAFSIAYIMSMKRMTTAIYTMVNKTEENLNKTLSELKGTLENVRNITGDVSAVTEDVSRISHSVASVERGLRELYGYLKEGLDTAVEANMAGLKAGIKTGVVTLVKNLQQGKE